MPTGPPANPCPLPTRSPGRSSARLETGPDRRLSNAAGPSGHIAQPGRGFLIDRGRRELVRCQRLEALDEIFRLRLGGGLQIGQPRADILRHGFLNGEGLVQVQVREGNVFRTGDHILAGNRAGQLAGFGGFLRRAAQAVQIGQGKLLAGGRLARQRQIDTREPVRQIAAGRRFIGRSAPGSGTLRAA